MRYVVVDRRGQMQPDSDEDRHRHRDGGAGRAGARGNAAGESAIDLLIVVDDLWTADLHERLSRLQADVRSWTGNDLQLIEHSLPSWRKLVRAKNPLVEQIRLDGVDLAGDIAELLGRRR